MVERPETRTVQRTEARTAEQPEARTVEHPEARTVEYGVRHHHQIHRHLIMEEQAEGECKDDKAKSKSWNLPNQ